MKGGYGPVPVDPRGPPGAPGPYGGKGQYKGAQPGPPGSLQTLSLYQKDVEIAVN